MAKNFKVQVIFGEQAVDYWNEHNCTFETMRKYINRSKVNGCYGVYEFDTRKEAIAFCQGLEQAMGWEELDARLKEV